MQQDYLGQDSDESYFFNVREYSTFNLSPITPL